MFPGSLWGPVLDKVNIDQESSTPNPGGCCVRSQSMPEYARVGQSMSEWARICQSCPRYAQNMPRIPSRYGHDMPSNPLIHGIITNICDIIIYKRGTLSVTYTHLHIVRGTLSVTYTHLTGHFGPNQAVSWLLVWPCASQLGYWSKLHWTKYRVMFCEKLEYFGPKTASKLPVTGHFRPNQAVSWLLVMPCAS